MSVLPMKCRRYLIKRGVCFEEHEEGPQKGVILKAFVLPMERFDVPSADILVLLPSGYPDTPPDMFYAIPWLKLASSNSYPNRADQSFEFGRRNWQRWSRHNNEWRAGVGGWNMDYD